MGKGLRVSSGLVKHWLFAVQEECQILETTVGA